MMTRPLYFAHPKLISSCAMNGMEQISIHSLVRPGQAILLAVWHIFIMKERVEHLRIEHLSLLSFVKFVNYVSL